MNNPNIALNFDLIPLDDEFLTQPLFPDSRDEAFDFFGSVLVAGDFNGDGFGDLSIGVPDEDIDLIPNSGRVSTIYGSFFSGLDTFNTQILEQAGLIPFADDAFGASLTSGDFNGDGFDDLAIGIVGEDVVFPFDNAGALSVAFGSFSGLLSTSSQVFFEDAFFPIGLSEPDDFFGSTLAAADFNGDGFDDLAIGVPNQDFNFGLTVDAGEVAVLSGSPFGLTVPNSSIFNQVGPESFARLGASLSTGDYNGDGFDDLVIGVPGQTVNGFIDAGGINYLYGSPSGLTAEGGFLDQATPGISARAEAGDAFGTSLASGDFNADGFDDVVVGSPRDDVDSDDGHSAIVDAGLINVINGSPNGLTGLDDQLIRQNDLFGDFSEDGDLFGASLAVGDFNGDGYDDLAAGAPGEDLPGIIDAGAVNVIYGGATGLRTANSQRWTQNTAGVLDVAESFDQFGASLTAHDFDGDGFDDLAIGVPGEDLGGIQDTGAVQILYGSINGLVA